jgi:lipoprotein-anchoring transpeptidase ErfK/SrfK
VLAVAATSAGSAFAEESKTETSDSVPTVIIINKVPANTQAPMLPQLDVSPPAAAEPQAANAPPLPNTPVSAPSVPDAPTPTNGAASAVTPSVNAPGPAPVAAAPAPLPPTLSIDIDLARQLMTVSEHGAPLHTWQISSARYGYRTPTGTFEPTWMAKMWYSRQYDLAPMPHAIFFHKGVAIHGTYATRALGNPASHGCVRLALGNAATLFKLVTRHGKERTQIVVHGAPDHSMAGRVAAFGARPPEEVVRFPRASSSYRYLPPSYYGRANAAYGYGTTRRAYAAPRHAPRRGYSYGYGF